MTIIVTELIEYLKTLPQDFIVEVGKSDDDFIEVLYLMILR